MLTLLRSVVIFFSFVHPCLPLYLLFFWGSCVARIYCFARPNREACSQAILAEKGELWGERDGGGEPCRGLRRADHSLSPAFFRYFALRLLLAIFPLKKPCPRLTVIKNGQDLIDQKQAPCSCLDSCLASVLQRFCFASLPQVLCRNIRHFPTSWVQFPSACYAGHLDVNRKRAMLCMTKYRGWGEGRRKNTRHNEINDKGYQTTVKLD